MKKRVIKELLAVSLLFLLTGCASMISGTKQDIKISTEPSGAHFKIEQLTVSGIVPLSEGTTPSNVSLNRMNSYLVTLTKENYNTEEVPIEYSKGNPWIVLDCLFLPPLMILPMYIDMQSGAAFYLEPDEVNMTLKQSGAKEKVSSTITSKGTLDSKGTEASPSAGKE